MEHVKRWLLGISLVVIKSASVDAMAQFFEPGPDSSRSCDDVCVDTQTVCLTNSETACAPDFAQCVKGCQATRAQGSPEGAAQ